MADDALEETLRACLTEQVKVTLLLDGASVSGVVARVDGGLVELRDGAERVLVRIDRIAAVRRP